MDIVRRNYFIGFAISILSVFLLEINDAMLKAATNLVKPSYIFLYKQMYVLFWYFVFAFLTKQKQIIPRVKFKKLVFVRCICGVAMGVFFIIGLSYTNMAVMQTCNMIYPVFATLLALFLLKEKIYWYDILGLLISFCGVLIIINIKGDFNLGAIFGAISGIAFGIFIVLTKMLDGLGEDKNVNVFYLAISYLLYGICNAIFYSNDSFFYFDFKAHVLFLFSGLVYFVYLHALMKALSLVKTSTYAVIEYTSIGWAVLFDYIIWQLSPTYRLTIGIIFILIAKLIILYFNSNGVENTYVKTATK